MEFCSGLQQRTGRSGLLPRKVWPTAMSRPVHLFCSSRPTNCAKLRLSDIWGHLKVPSYVFATKFSETKRILLLYLQYIVSLLLSGQTHCLLHMSAPYTLYRSVCTHTLYCTMQLGQFRPSSRITKHNLDSSFSLSKLLNKNFPLHLDTEGIGMEYGGGREGLGV